MTHKKHKTVVKFTKLSFRLFSYELRIKLSLDRQS